jgi:hypothetical protein
MPISPCERRITGGALNCGCDYRSSMPDRFNNQNARAEAPISSAIDQRNPLPLSVSRSPLTFMPKMPAIKLAGKNTVATIANTCRWRLV